MSPATWPREDPRSERLLVLSVPSGRRDDARLADLPRLLDPGDLVVVNDAATLPASLAGRTEAGAPIEARLIAQAGESWTAVLFGDRDWRTKTEHRPPPPPLAAGARLAFGDLAARVAAVSPLSPRLVTLAFDARGAAFWSALYRRGRPVQYAHVDGPLELWHAQTPFGARPWAVELPSAGRPLAWSILGELARRGVARAAITHAAGLSSTGDPALDAALPFPERYDVPAATVDAVLETKRRGGRVVAVGTTVVRALEGAARAHGGRLAAGEGTTDLRIDAAFAPRVVDAVLSGVHEPGSSHFALLSAFAQARDLERAYAHAEARGYLGHEFGDSCLILPERSNTLAA